MGNDLEKINSNYEKLIKSNEEELEDVNNLLSKQKQNKEIIRLREEIEKEKKEINEFKKEIENIEQIDNVRNKKKEEKNKLEDKKEEKDRRISLLYDRIYEIQNELNSNEEKKKGNQTFYSNKKQLNEGMINLKAKIDKYKKRQIGYLDKIKICNDEIEENKSKKEKLINNLNNSMNIIKKKIQDRKIIIDDLTINYKEFNLTEREYKKKIKEDFKNTNEQTIQISTERNNKKDYEKLYFETLKNEEELKRRNEDQKKKNEELEQTNKNLEKNKKEVERKNMYLLKKLKN